MSTNEKISKLTEAEALEIEQAKADIKAKAEAKAEAEDKIKAKQGSKLKDTATFKQANIVWGTGVPIESYDKKTQELILEMTTREYETWKHNQTFEGFEIAFRKKAGQVTKLKAEVESEKAEKEKVQAELERVNKILAELEKQK